MPTVTVNNTIRAPREPSSYLSHALFYNLRLIYSPFPTTYHLTHLYHNLITPFSSSKILSTLPPKIVSSHQGAAHTIFQHKPIHQTTQTFLHTPRIHSTQQPSRLQSQFHNLLPTKPHPPNHKPFSNFPHPKPLIPQHQTPSFT